MTSQYSSSYNFDSESGGGVTFPMGQADNVFGANSGSSVDSVTIASSLAVAEATRDTYDAANTGWKDSYLDLDLNIILYYLDGSTRYIQYQRNVGGVWTNNTGAVVGIQGEQGEPGNDTQSSFSTEAARDAFYSTGTNYTELTNGFTVMVGQGGAVTSYYTWVGDDNPTSYDANNFKLATGRFGTGSVELGEAHKITSSGNNVATVNIATNEAYHSVWQTYEDGNTAVSRTRVTNPPVTLSDKTADLVNPSWTYIPSTINQTVYQATVDFTNAVNNLVIEADLDGVDFYRVELGAFASGEQDLIFDPPIDIKVGQVLSFSVSDDFNGTVTLKGNAGTGLPYQVLYTQTFTDKPLPTFNSVTTNIGSLAFFDSTDGTGLEGTSTITYSESGNDAALTFAPVAATGEVQIEFENSAGDTELSMGFDESLIRAEVDIYADNGLAFNIHGETLATGININGLVIGDEGRLLTMSSLSANGSSVGFIVGERNPQNTVISGGGVFYLRGDGVNSTIYAKRSSAVDTSGWVDLLATGSGDVSGPDSSVDGAMAAFSGTSGKNLQSFDNIVTSDNGVDLAIVMTSPATNGATTFEMKDNAGTTQFFIQYDDILDQAQIFTTDTLEINSSNWNLNDDGTDTNLVIKPASVTGEAHVTVQDIAGTYGLDMYVDETTGDNYLVATGADLKIRQESSTNTIDIWTQGGGAMSIAHAGSGGQAVLILTAEGTNGDTIQLFCHNTTPENFVSANRGDVCFSASDTDGVSSIWVKRSGADDTATGWVSVFAGGSGDVTGPATSVDNALSTWNGTGGDELNSIGSVTLTESSTGPTLTASSLDASTGTSDIIVADSSGTTKVHLEYDEAGDTATVYAGGAVLTDDIDASTKSLLLNPYVSIISNGSTVENDITLLGNTNSMAFLNASGLSLLYSVTADHTNDAVNMIVNDMTVVSSSGSNLITVQNNNLEIDAQAGNVGITNTAGGNLSLSLINPTSTSSSQFQIDSTGGTPKFIAAYDENTDSVSIASTTTLGIIGDNFTLTDDGTDHRLLMDVPGTGGESSITFRSSTNATELIIGYDETDDSAFINSTGIFTAYAGPGFFTFDSSGTTANLVVNSNAPEGFITSPRGSLMLRDTGSDDGNSGAYIKLSGTGATGWAKILTEGNAGNVTGPGATVVAESLPYWTDTDGLTLGANDQITHTVLGSSNTVFNMRSASISGSARIEFEENTGNLFMGGLWGIEGDEVRLYTANDYELNIESSDVLTISNTTTADDVIIKTYASFTTANDTANYLDMRTPTSTQKAGMRFLDTSLAEKGALTYDEDNDQVDFSAEYATFAVDFDMRLQADDIFIVSTSTLGQDAFSFGQGGVQIQHYMATATPKDNYTANPGDFAWRENGSDSNLYINIGSSNNNQTWASVLGQELMFGDGSIGTTTTTRYLTPGYDQGAAPTTEIGRRVTKSGYLRSLQVLHNAPAGNGNNITYTVRVNGVNTALTATLASTASTAEDNTNLVSISKGDIVTVSCQQAAGIGTGTIESVVTMELV